MEYGRNGAFPMKFSIVTPSYNQARFLREAIESVLSQDADLEYIVLDAASRDGSAEIIRSYKDRLTYWASRPDDGQASAIDDGFRMSSGSILGWLNSDDVLCPKALSYVEGWFTQHPAAQFMYGACDLIDEGSKRVGRLVEPCYSTNWQIHVRNCVNQPSAFWRRELYVEVGGLDRSLHYAMDYDLWFRFCALTTPQVTRRLLSRERLHAGTKTQANPGILETELELVRQRHFDLPARSGRRHSRLFWRAHRLMTKAVTGCYSLR